MSYHHFTTYERGRIEELLSLGYSHRKIAERLGRHRSSIDREIHRNATSEGYGGEHAQVAYSTRRKHSKPKGKRTDDLVTTITEKLWATWSPEQIANTVTLGIVSFKTIYNWLYSGVLSAVTVRNLRQKGRRRKTEKRGKFSMGIPISERPHEVKSREVFGHWELDSMVSSRGESKGCFATFVERKSRLYTAFKTPDRTASSMQTAITALYNILPKGAFQTGTTDRGKEFACCTAIQDQLGLTLYFADAYSSWQRGSNENSNGLLREFYPKKTNLALVCQEELTHNLFLINSRPRKCLGWKSPIQVFLHEVAHLS
ncbi:IS30 family transposase [Anaerotignum propionicum]|uniref:Integrase core domain protein n=1 Tax=Anaerotignum propionicum DSM 1682 TaxID=991789 RepID=A0A0X1U921_ANAPI|nr:IS30 family transposase [Anaerotignum propionicum]AMJ41436.1 integrase core domain protein [Anaerotignum propionicum DSM 1682]SHE68338.1 transposase, IS30 family [[Clostridium] propionicum DSM 1682] [Anaerotignum propionicum DSM 1682]